MQHLKALVSQLLATNLPADLKTLHDLALYDSGDALLGEEEKQSLLNTIQLAQRLEDLTDAERQMLSEIVL